MDGELIQVVQLPVIAERLQSAKAAIQQRVEEAESLACTEDTIQAVKSTRAELRKEFSVFEEQRKAVKSMVLGPYEAFEAVYRECVGEAYKGADEALRGKIADVENEIKKRCECEMREYFTELCTAEHVEWLEYDRAGLRIGMTEAKQKGRKRLKESLSAFVSGVADCVQAIEKMDHAAEILVEYKATLDMARSIATVQDHHQRIAEEQAQAEQRKEVMDREAEAVRRVEEVAPPEPVFAERFQINILRPTRSQLIKLREFMKQEGIIYEC